MNHRLQTLKVMFEKSISDEAIAQTARNALRVTSAGAGAGGVDLGRVEELFAALQSEVATQKAEVMGAVKQQEDSINVLKGSVNELKGSVNVLEGSVNELKGSVQRIEARQKEMEAGIMNANVRMRNSNAGRTEPLEPLVREKPGAAVGSRPPDGMFPSSRDEVLELTQPELSRLADFYGVDFGGSVRCFSNFIGVWSLGEPWPSQQPLPPTPLSPATARALARTFRAGDLAYASAGPLRLWCEGPAAASATASGASAGSSASGAASGAGFGAAGDAAGAPAPAPGPRPGRAPVAAPPDVLLLAPVGTPRDLCILVAAIERLLERPPPRGCVGCLVLAPSRERAAALHEAAFALLGERGGGAAVGDSMHVQVVHGGAPFRDDVAALRANPPQLLVATPGRLGQLLRGGSDGGGGGGGAGGGPGGGRRGGREGGEVKLGHLFGDVRLLLLDSADQLAASPELRAATEALLRRLPGTRLATPAADAAAAAAAAGRGRARATAAERGRDGGGGGAGGAGGAGGPVLVLAAAADLAGEGGAPRLPAIAAAAAAAAAHPAHPAVAAGAAVDSLNPALQALARVALRPGYAVMPMRPAGAAHASTATTVASANDRSPAVGLQAPAGQDTLAGAVTAALSLALAAGRSSRRNTAAAAAAAEPPTAVPSAAAPPPPPPLPLHVLPVSYGDHLSYLYVVLRQHMISEARHKMVVQLPTAALASLYARIFAALGFPAAEAHGRTPPAAREAAVRAFASAPRGLLFTTPGAGPGMLGAGGGGSAPSLTVWVGPPPPTLLTQQLAALQQSSAAAAASAVDLMLLPPQALQQQLQPGQQPQQQPQPAAVPAAAAAAAPPPLPPRCLMLLTGLEQYTHAAQNGRGRGGGSGGSGGPAAATEAVLAATEAALAAVGLGRMLVLQPGSWTGALEAVQRRVGQAMPKVSMPLKQRALEGLLGHLWATSTASAAAAAGHAAGRGSSGSSSSTARSRVTPDMPVAAAPPPPPRAQELQLQPPARPSAAPEGRRPGPGPVVAPGTLSPGQLGMAARAFAAVMGMPQPPQLSRSAAAAMGLSHIPGVSLRAPTPPTLPKPPGRPPRPQRDSKRQAKLRRERRIKLRARLRAAGAAAGRAKAAGGGGGAGTQAGAE
ncbi:hypothetical protein HXX76_003180 [Chlamydomonas incerta]|uniref:ATP-dependent RNA helicase n=1 Tax=Chlamydomonas incerta TaxID=51695 RepID=A0A835TJE2_CHLIN|nr:hypothetical protein HXX76_003180 [Chlamydomonas incerta]|eukprot:KAG2441559.1 hypothetical protein HXX76_003180 [Chlamydomonas incerta]